MAVFGTAGHVDHGKSTLIERLTGRDPDRWDEEKSRGLTIDLGFAWLEASSGAGIAFVDVPGHERFIKNMLAGIEAIDAALLVVAADEGWMPQSEEHLAVLDLLDIERGVVALTKADLVDADLMELAQLEVAEHLEGTSLAHAPIVAVSAKTGDGIDVLRRHLEELAATVEDERPPSDRPRMWVDRSFTIAGAGTVVTGTLTEGTFSVGDELVLLPGNLPGRVRGLHQHEHERQTVVAGSRCAVNLAGLEWTAIGRGMMLGRPGDWLTSKRWLARITAARYEEGDPTERGAYHVHFGTGAWPAEVRPIDGHPGYAVIRLHEAVPVTVGDRFVLREVGRRAIVAGGLVIDPHPARKRSVVAGSIPVLEGIESDPPDLRAHRLLSVRRTARISDLRAWSGGGIPSGVIGDVAVSNDMQARLRLKARETIDRFHEDHPLRPGIPRARLAQELGIERTLLDSLVTDWPVVDHGATIASPEFTVAADLTVEAWESIERTLREAGLTVPRVKDLDIDSEMLHVFFRQGRLVRVSDDLAYLPDQLETIQQRIRELGTAFTVAEFRDALDLSRKYAVPLLEYFDATGLTVRDGDLRTVRS